MSNIEWLGGSVCFADGVQCNANANKVEKLIVFNDFQLNEIRQGDYIEASELDTEQKYNDVVEVFGLFGFEWGDGAENSYSDVLSMGSLTICHDGIFATEVTPKWCARKLTYPQLMAIGKLKRAMIERDESNDLELPNISNCKTSKDYLNECIEVQNQRGEQYDSKGTGERSFAAAASAFNAMTGQNIKGSDVCLLLTCVKAVRQYSDPTRVHEDSLLDLVSYAALWAEEINKELK